MPRMDLQSLAPLCRC